MASYELGTVFGGGYHHEKISFWARCKKDVNPTPEQRRILMIIGIQVLVITFMYQWRVTRWLLYPFELIGTVFHEFGHVLMCVLTGGKVESIDINIDESGLTRFSGGWFCLISPAGYIGSSLAGCALLFAGFGRRTSRYVAIIVNLILLITLFWGGSLTTVTIALILVSGMSCVVWYEEGRYTQFVILFMGTIASIISVLNILSSTVFHTIDGSDAVAFAQRCSVLIPAFVYGLIWALISLVLIAGSIALALIFYK